MRTSNQLNNTGMCSRNVRASLTSVSRNQMLAGAQIEVVNRLLRGEPIPDISGEIDNILVEKGFVWENVEQRIESEAMFEKRIKKFIAFEGPKEKVFPDGLDTVVDYFGEDIEAKPSYFIVSENSVEVCKVTASTYTNTADDCNRQEMYALGLCGEKLFPGKEVYVTRLHLRGKTSTEKTAFEMNPRGEYKDPYNLTSTIRLSQQEKERYTAMKEESKDSVCSPEECAGCPQKNICHFEQPPIFIPVEQTVKPISDVRLTYEQKQVIDFEKGIARVNAGPGGGKTLVTAMRITELLKKGAEPEDFCLLTYTNAGAEEMTARVMNYAASSGMPLDPERFQSGTINSFCQKIITDNYEALGYTAPPRIIMDDKKKRIINDLITSYPKISDWSYYQMSDSKFIKGRFSKSALKMLELSFSKIKRENINECDLCEEFPELSAKDLDVLYKMYNEYESILKKNNLLEFDDHIPLVNKLYMQNETLFADMGYKHIMVDEFQDTDLPQIELLQKMIDTPQFESFVVVGDDSQSIFGFRHTSPEFMINFDSYFGRFSDFSLTENHRSTKNIVDFANDISSKMENKVEKTLIPTKTEKTQPDVKGYYSKKEELNAIANDIAQRWEAGERDISVLMSQRNQLREMASALSEKGIPSVMMCRIPYVENSRVAALQTFYDSWSGNGTQGLADYANVMMDGALAATSPEEVDRIIEELKERLDGETRSLSSFLEFADQLDENKIDMCYQDFLEKVKYCKSAEELDDFWQDFRIYGHTSEYKREGKYEGVCLNTIHSSKGLEWDTVYLSLTGLDSLSMHKRVTPQEKDETLRKFFVGSTRAREHMIITGEYVLAMEKSGAVLNDYLKMAYDIAHKPYDYHYANYWSTQMQEKVEASSKAAASALPSVRHTVSQDIADAIQRHVQRAAEKAQKEIEM